MSIVIGIDPAYGECGLIVLKTDTGEIVHQSIIKTDSEESEMTRARKMWLEICIFLETKSSVDAVVIEGLAFGKAFKAHQMGYLHYRLREYLEKHKTKPLIVIPSPTQLKKFVTGTGKVKKELMLLNVYKHWGVEFNNNNLADAYGLAQIGRYYVGAEKKPFKYREEVIQALKDKK